MIREKAKAIVEEARAIQARARTLARVAEIIGYYLKALDAKTEKITTR